MDMFNGLNIKIKMRRLIIVILMAVAGLTTLMAQQTHDIKGVVTDKRNEPIVGALVTAEGTDISSITDIDGKFLLRDVPAEVKTVVVESIGMETEEVKIDQPIMMAAWPKRLSLVLEAGLDWSRYTVEGSDAKNGYHVGIGMEVRMSKRWAFRPMVQLANRGAEYVFSDGEYSYKETWNPLMLDVPLNFLIRYDLARNMSLVLSFGPVFSWGLSGKVKVSGIGGEDTEYDIYDKKYPSSWGGPDHALLHPLGFGMTYGIGVEYKKLLIGVSGKNMGIITEDDGIGEVNEHNFVLGASVSYRF